MVGVRYTEIWSTQVPPKVRIFAWRLSQEGLATQYHMKKRTLTNDATCRICATEVESGYHVVVQCNRAAALGHELRQHWILPEEERFHFTGLDWLLLLLSSVDAEAKAKTLLLLWRAWHLRNDIM
jgi:hypothetical protein